MSSKRTIEQTVDFPRGGSTPLSKLDIRETIRDANLDFEPELVETTTPKKKLRTNPKKFKKLTESEKNLGKDITTEKKDFSIETLTFKKLKVGLALLGQIKEINDLDMVMSLPDQLTGFISITEVSDYITKKLELAAAEQNEDDEDTDESDIPDLKRYFKVGQYLPCSISVLDDGRNSGREAGASTKRRVELSLRPDFVNQSLDVDSLSSGMNILGSISSEEDHGYIVNLGVHGINGFLFKKNTKNFLASSSSTGENLEIGQVLLFQILTMNDKTAKLTLDPEIVSKASLPASSNLTFDSLKPGMLVSGKVKTVLNSGIQISFQDLFVGTCSLFHLNELVKVNEEGEVLDQLAKNFSVGRNVKCRVIYVDSIKKRIGLSLNSKLVNFEMEDGEDEMEVDGAGDKPIIGTKLLLKVCRSDEGKGLVMCSEDEKIIAYCHKSRISDGENVKMDKHYKSGTLHEARIISLNPFDKVVGVSLQKSVLDHQFLLLDEFKVGQQIKTKIIKLTPKGMVVSVTDSINGFIPKLHMSDVLLLRDPSKLFKIGASIKCRVLLCDPSEKRLILTHKKSFLGSELMVLDSYVSAKEGEIYLGVINSVTNFGVFVSFYNQITGFVHISELSDDYIRDPLELFKIGQAVKCRVISVVDDKLRLSFKMKSNQIGGAVSKHLPPGAIVSAKIVSKQSTSFTLSLNTPHQQKAILKFTHLTDSSSPAHITILAKHYKVGAEIDRLLVIETDSKSGDILTSLKPALFSVVANGSSGVLGLNDLKNLEVGKQVCGVVRKVLDSGCIVGFVGGLKGLARLHSISDRFISNINEAVKEGNTVLATITEIDLENTRMSVTLKNSINFNSSRYVESNKYESMLLESFFFERDLVYANVLSKQNKKGSLIKEVKIGGWCKGTVAQILPYGVVFTLDLGSEDEKETAVSGLMTTYQVGLRKFVVGEVVEGLRVLDVDLEKSILDLGLGGKVLDEKKTAVEIGRITSAFESKTVLNIKVEMIKEDYLIASLPSFNDEICFVSVKTFNSSESPFSKFKEGQKLKIVISKTRSLLETPVFTGLLPQRTIGILRITEAKKESSILDLRKKIVDPVDPKITTLEDLVPGARVKVRVKSIKPNQLNVQIGGNLSGRIHVSELVDSFNEISNLKQPLKKFKVGEILDTKVVSFFDTKTYHTLAITKKTSPSSLKVDLTIRKVDLDLPDFKLNGLGASRYPTLESLSVGDKIDTAFIQAIFDDYMLLSISPNQICRVQQICCSVVHSALVSPLENTFKLGQAVRCFVLSKNLEKKQMEVSLIDPTFKIEKGMKIAAKIIKVSEDYGLVLQIGSSKIQGRVHLTDICDNFNKTPTQNFKKGEFMECFVISFENDQLDLSLRQSRLNPTTGDDNVVVAISEDKYKEIKSLDDIAQGQLVQGYIKNISDVGCFVQLNRKISARVKISDLSDKFVKEWKTIFKKGQLVKGRILSVSKENERVEMSLKESAIDPSATKKKLLTLDNLEIGAKFKGVVRKIEKFGVFVKLDNSHVSGLCHSSEISDDLITADFDKLFAVGDVVKVIVLKVDIEKKRVSLGMKASYFEDLDAMDIECSEEDEVDSDKEDSDDNKPGPEETTIDVKKTNIESDMMDVDLTELMKEAKPLDLESDDEIINHDEKEDGSDKEAEAPKRKSKAEKQHEKEAAEALILKKEAMIASGDTAPEAAEDFERLLLGSPNSSFLWIKYMAYEFQLAEIQKARQIAERALKTISFREEKEKLNIWVAMMNLENSYGTAASLKKIFDRAVMANEPKAIYMQLAQIYIRTEQKTLAEEIFTAMLKKFKQSSKIWSTVGLFYLQEGKIEESRQTLQKSLKSLPKHKHIKTTSKFGQYEYKHGEPERGRTIFEGIISNHPKRIDIWNVFLDMEIKAGDKPGIRRLFERVISMKFSSKKMKSLFKKYLEFEKSLGDEGLVEHVKESALRYVEASED